MKKKLLSTTYLNEAEKYKIKFYMNEEDKCVVVKKLDKISKPFIIGDGIIAMDNGYYILEIVPKNEKYALRLFFNDKKEIVEYYFDIIKESGVDEKTKIPYFIDAYLDITISRTGEIKILDRNELDEALENGNLSKEEYNNVLETSEKLLDEINNKTNELLNIDYLKYLKDMWLGYFIEEYLFF